MGTKGKTGRKRNHGRREKKGLPVLILVSGRSWNSRFCRCPRFGGMFVSRSNQDWTTQSLEHLLLINLWETDDELGEALDPLCPSTPTETICERYSSGQLGHMRALSATGQAGSRRSGSIHVPSTSCQPKVSRILILIAAILGERMMKKGFTRPVSARTSIKMVPWFGELRVILPEIFALVETQKPT